MSEKDPKNSKDSFIQNAIDELSKLHDLKSTLWLEIIRFCRTKKV